MTPYVPTTERIQCVPLYSLTDPKTDTVEFLGTGTLVTFRGVDLLVTAAHVIDNGKQYRLMAACPGDTVLFGGPPTLVSPVQRGLTRENDPLDLCVIRLMPEEAARLRAKYRFIDWECEALTDAPSKEYRHKLTGYPDTANLAKEEKKLDVNYLRVDVMEDRSVIQHAPSEGIKAQPTWYVGLRYDPRLLEKQTTRPKVKSLHGCSGGAIWRTDGCRVLGFAGVVVVCLSPKSRRTGERILYGFRAKAMNGLLRRWVSEGHP